MPDDEVDEQSSARPFSSGTISFGLVSIPVNLFPANRSSRVRVRMLAPDGTPLRRRYYSSKTDEELAPEQSRDIDLRRFANADKIPPLYFERAYFLAPAADSTKAYQLLAAVMEKTGRAGVATFVMRGKEYFSPSSPKTEFFAPKPCASRTRFARPVISACPKNPRSLLS